MLPKCYWKPTEWEGKASVRTGTRFLLTFCYNCAMIFASIPVVAVFSLCYAATRYEELGSIFRHAFYFGGWLAFAMVLVIGIMEAIQIYLR